MTVVSTARLDLVSMELEFLDALIEGDFGKAATLAELSDAPQWEGGTYGLELRRNQLREDPTMKPWLLRRIILRETNVMIGHIGFHSKPDPPYLMEFTHGGIELGYTIFEKHRRQGYAHEAIKGLIAWAHYTQSVQRFIVSISPTNQPSMALAHKIGFRKFSSHIDPIDGPEDILEFTPNAP